MNKREKMSVKDRLTIYIKKERPLPWFVLTGIAVLLVIALVLLDLGSAVQAAKAPDALTDSDVQFRMTVAGDICVNDSTRRLANEIGVTLGKPAFVVDPPVVDEMMDVARLSGRPDYPRRAMFHALNQKAIAKRYAEEIGRPYEELNLIVCHMGGGTSVGCHCKGRVIDVNNGLEGAGAFTGERCGGLTALDVVKATLSGKWGTTYEQIRHELCMCSGLVGHTGTNDGREITRRIAEGDKQAELAYRTMAYQVAKEISALGAPLHGQVDAILLTGGFAYDKTLMSWIESYVSYLAPVHVYPGEDEMMALAQGALRVLRGREEAKVY